MSPAAEKFKELTNPEGALAKEREKLKKPPFEFFRTQIAPSEIIPYTKPNHWSTLSLEMRANHAAYDGFLRTAPVRLLDMSHDLLYRRDARLLEEQDARISMQILIPLLPKDSNELDLELIRPESIRGDGITQAIIQRILPHQMLVPVLGPEAPKYAPWSRFQATIPTSVDPDPSSADRLRYYRFVTSQDPERSPPLSAHPLTWTTISHVIWDGLNTNEIDIGQQQALVDWLHWGGQLIIVGGAGPSLAPLQDSFLDPLLPATPSGKNVSLDGKAFSALSSEYLAPYRPIEGETGTIPRYVSEPEPIRTTRDRSIFLSGLTPKPGATPIPLGDPDDNLLGVEWRVGRGRVLMLTVKLTDPALLAWPGLDSLVRRVVFRRPEEARAGRGFAILPATQLSWVRIVGRDLGAVANPGAPLDESSLMAGDNPPPMVPVGAWLDSATLPVDSRNALEKASGITIPGSDFVLKVILAYIVALVPLNWLLCRFVLRRREWAWAVTPVLSLGFAIAVERAAAYDMGFDSACDEIDLVEIQGPYPRAHVSRFAALYSTGRLSFTIAYPQEPTALALPMSMGPDRYQRGGDIARSVWESAPVPALTSFTVQPRSLAMFRAEQMDDIPGGISITEEGVKSVVNRTGLELRDAVVVHVASGDRYRLGNLGPGRNRPSVIPNRPQTLSSTTHRDATVSHRPRVRPPTSRHHRTNILSTGSTSSRSWRNFATMIFDVPRIATNGGLSPGVKVHIPVRNFDRRWIGIGGFAWSSPTSTTARRPLPMIRSFSATPSEEPRFVPWEASLTLEAPAQEPPAPVAPPRP